MYQWYSNSVLIVVNGSLINSKDEIEELEKKNKYLDVDFILVQSKTSTDFDAGAIAKFLIGSTDFFADNSVLPANTCIKDKRQLMEFIYTKSSLVSAGEGKFIDQTNWFRRGVKDGGTVQKHISNLYRQVF